MLLRVGLGDVFLPSRGVPCEKQRNETSGGNNVKVSRSRGGGSGGGLKEETKWRQRRRSQNQNPPVTGL